MKGYYVYMHTFPNGKVYIGITSQKPTNRWGRDGKGYRRKKKGKWTQPIMARATLKYSWDDIKHEILFEGLTKEEAEAKEIELIAFYKSNHDEYGYNIDDGGSVPTLTKEVKEKISEAHKGKKHSEETKRKISEASKGRKMPEEAIRKTVQAHKGKKRSEESKLRMQDVNKKKKSVCCVETGKVYASIRQAERETGIDNATISRVCNGKQKTAGGYHWKFYEEDIAV